MLLVESDDPILKRVLNGAELNAAAVAGGEHFLSFIYLNNLLLGMLFTGYSGLTQTHAQDVSGT